MSRNLDFETGRGRDAMTDSDFFSPLGIYTEEITWDAGNDLFKIQTITLADISTGLACPSHAPRNPHPHPTRTRLRGSETASHWQMVSEGFSSWPEGATAWILNPGGENYRIQPWIMMLYSKTGNNITKRLIQNIRCKVIFIGFLDETEGRCLGRDPGSGTWDADRAGRVTAGSSGRNRVLGAVSVCWNNVSEKCSYNEQGERTSQTFL